MSAPYILARTFADAHVFARKTLGLGAGYYRVVNSPGSLKAVRGVDLYLVPGWEKRFDRFAMQSALKWTRMNVIDVAKEPDKVPTPERADSQFPGSDVEAPAAPAAPSGGIDDFFNVVGFTAAEPPVAAEPDGLEPAGEQLAIAVEAPAEPKKGRRRSRCKQCGNLHYKEDPCPEGDE